MPLQKQNLSVSFSKGLDTKTDPKQIMPGKFLSLQNTIFQKGGLLQKRNGYAALPSLPDSSYTTLTTFNTNLTAVGTKLSAFSADTNQWISTGTIQPVQVSVLPVVRNSTSQTQVDIAISPNGLACAVYLDSSGSNFYQIVDSSTGQVIIQSTSLPSTATLGRVFVLGQYFIITFLATVSAATHLQYIHIPINGISSASSPIDLATNVASLSAGYDGYVANNNLYFAWYATGTSVKVGLIDSTLVQHATITLAGHVATLMSVMVDTTGSNSVVWVSFYDSGSQNGYTAAFNQMLVTILSPTLFVSSRALVALTSSASFGINTIFYEVQNAYSFSPNARTDYINRTTVNMAGSVSPLFTVILGSGLASKAFFLSANQTIYLLIAYGQAFQPTYFLMDSNGNIVAKVAYSNGAGYVINQILPGVTLNGSIAQIGYLFKDLLVPVNKSQGASNVAGVYSQTGINLASFDITAQNLVTSEIGHNLHIAGGFLWMYDGVKPVEHQFHVWPEDLQVSTITTGGNITDQQYFYVGTYEWTDGQGNIHRSAPSVPLGVTTSGGGTSTNTIHFPTLRQTYKTAPNKVRLVLYRWSQAQQTYYQVTSIQSPTLNETTVDSIDIVDTLADSSILGNVILYTTGGVVEDIAAPCCSSVTLFKSRLFLIDAEDTNLLWFSKQVIEAVPVEMSDLFTLFVAPTIGAQGGTGPMKCLFPMDDKLIIFKQDAMYYITGNGPDNTGANNDFSEPIFISGTVGSSNQQSLVMIPNGIIFQSDKGFWLLGRDLSTSYIGAPVEAFNSATVNSALTVPGTNQVRFTLSSGVTLMYDYYYDQWTTFTGIPAISSTLFGGLHTFLNASGGVLQETPGLYLDGASPVLISFTTGWFNLAGLQGFQRAYFVYLLAEYFSPHKLTASFAYDYDPAITQVTKISPTNFSPPFGNDALFGNSAVFGGGTSIEQWKIFLQKQKCQSFQLTLTESYDSSFGMAPGAGFTMSGMNIVVGGKLVYPKLAASQQVG